LRGAGNQRSLTEQNPPTQPTFAPLPQQSLSAVQASPTCEQPLVGPETQLPSSEPAGTLQNPEQHSKPCEQVWPVACQASSAQ